MNLEKTELKPSVSGFYSERRSSGMSELSQSCVSEGYAACCDEEGDVT